MAAEKGYQGWTNYETWNVKLWIDNDQGLAEYWQEQTENIHSENKGDFNDTKYLLADALKDEIENQAEDVLEAANASATMWADLLHAALNEVNWQEIAEAMIRDYLDNVEYERVHGK